MNTVSDKIAKQLRELGFNTPTEYYYFPDIRYDMGAKYNLVHKDKHIGRDIYSVEHQFNAGIYSNTILAPTRQDVIDWFISKHHIFPHYGPNHSGWYWSICKTNGTGIKEQEDCEYFETHYEALDEAISQAIKHIKK